MTEQTNAEATVAYFDLHRRHERLLAAVVGLRDTYRATAALHDRLGEPFKHAAWANRADDLDRILAPVVAATERVCDFRFGDLVCGEEPHDPYLAHRTSDGTLFVDPAAAVPVVHPEPGRRS
jgi:hypothetical protein